MYQIVSIWQDETYSFKYRVYAQVPEQQVVRVSDFTMLALFTRHHNGFIRSCAIQRLMHLYPKECIPYLVQLLGEYVVEICEIICKHSTKQQKAWVDSFLLQNKSYTRRIRSQVASYWDCYHRQKYPNLKDYPSFKYLFGSKAYK